jgi:filamentous hemagglutinin
MGQAGGRVVGVLKDIGIIVVTEGGFQVASFWWFVTKGDDAAKAAATAARGAGDEAVGALGDSGLGKMAPKGLPATTADSVADKLGRYLLDPNHPVGGDKATWFRKALGFTQDNLDDLARQIKFDPSKAIATELTQHGQKFEQVIQIVGANGKRIDVLFVWIRNNDGVVRLVTSTLGV